jgi:hypothetical protein
MHQLFILWRVVEQNAEVYILYPMKEKEYNNDKHHLSFSTLRICACVSFWILLRFLSCIGHKISDRQKALNDKSASAERSVMVYFNVVLSTDGKHLFSGCKPSIYFEHTSASSRFRHKLYHFCGPHSIENFHYGALGQYGLQELWSVLYLSVPVYVSFLLVFWKIKSILWW